VNRYLIEAGVLDIHAGEVIGLVIETQCNYFAPLAFPQPIEAGIRVGRLGATSVRYEVGLFAEGIGVAFADLDDFACAHHLLQQVVEPADLLPAEAQRAADVFGCPRVFRLRFEQILDRDFLFIIFFHWGLF
jgi:acyl-CoA thioesterase FadM